MIYKAASYNKAFAETPYDRNLVPHLHFLSTRVRYGHHQGPPREQLTARITNMLKSTILLTTF